MNAGMYQGGTPAPDEEYIPASLAHLVVGNTGRMLDVRRTPVTVVGLSLERGSFSVRVEAFEDAGAIWELGLDEFRRFQFPRDSPRVPTGEVTALQRALATVERSLIVECDVAARERSLAEVSRRIAVVERWMRRRGARAPDISKVIASRRGDPLLCDLVLEFFAERDLDEHERAFTTSYVSNPRAGEVVKGHAIVLAELGLSPYRGKSVRAPDTFRGDWSKEKRSDHLLWRLAVSGAVWALAGTNPVTVYRGAAADRDFTATAPSSFVSGTLCREVAEEHFAGGPTTKVAYLWRQTVSANRVLMSFVETVAMNQHFAEGEIVLLPECGDAARWPLGTRHGLAAPGG